LAIDDFSKLVSKVAIYTECTNTGYMERPNDQRSSRRMFIRDLKLHSLRTTANKTDASSMSVKLPSQDNFTGKKFHGMVINLDIILKPTTTNKKNRRVTR